MSEKSAKKPIYRRIPGFRSGTKWKMVVASIFYLMVILAAAAGDVDEPSSEAQQPDIAAAEQQEDVGSTQDIVDTSDIADSENAEDQAQDSNEATVDKEEKSEPTSSEVTKPTGTMTVHFIDVGQGDAILIQTPSQNVLIDGGDRGNTVVNYLRARGVNSLDLVIGTHPHSDHIGGLINVFQSIPVKEVIDPAVVHTTKTFEDYLTLIDEKDIKFTEGRAGMTRDIGGGAKLEILHPSSPSRNHLNNASIVTKVTFGQVSFILTGDAEEDAEKQIKNRGYNLKSTVLKVGHHGSRTSTTTAFLNAVNPEAAVIMVGRNSYGHPHDETLAKLQKAGVKIYRTDVHGTIVFTTDGQRYEVNIKEAYQYNPPKEPSPSQGSTAAPAPAPAPAPKPDPQPQPEPNPEPEPAPEGQFVGSIKSDKYHYPNCRHAKNILPANEIWFKDVKDAKNQKYEPCGTCKPPS